MRLVRLAALSSTDVVGRTDFDVLWATFVGEHRRLSHSRLRRSEARRPVPIVATFLIPFVGVGILGAFTTFSLFSAEVFELARAGDWLLAVAYPLAVGRCRVRCCVVRRAVWGI